MMKIMIKSLADPREIKYSYGLNSDISLWKIDEFIEKA